MKTINKIFFYSFHYDLKSKLAKNALTLWTVRENFGEGFGEHFGELFEIRNLKCHINIFGKNKKSNNTDF